MQKHRFTAALSLIIASCFTTAAFAAPAVTGEPVVLQHYGHFAWPQDEATSTPYLTQPISNELNDLHGDMACDLIISTPGNYHFALLDAMKGRPDLGFEGLQAIVKRDHDVTVCWSTSPPVSVDQIQAESLQFKNVQVVGRPALAMGPGGVMNKLVANGLVDGGTRSPFLRNRGNVILVRTDMVNQVKDVCGLSKPNVRVATPNPDLEPGSFGNFSGTMFDVPDRNPEFKCHDTAEEHFNAIFGQDISSLDLSKLDNPFDLEKMQEFYKDEGQLKWVASARIMHRDIPISLCYDQADAAVIFYHQAKYLKGVAAGLGCSLSIIPMGGTEDDPQPLDGNRVGTLHIGKVTGSFPQKVLDARDVIYNFLVGSSIWTQIMDEYYLDDPN